MIRFDPVGGGRREVSPRPRVGELHVEALRRRNRVRFTARIGRRALRPGRYRARLVLRDAAGNFSSRRRIGFRVVR